MVVCVFKSWDLTQFFVYRGLEKASQIWQTPGNSLDLCPDQRGSKNPVLRKMCMKRSITLLNFDLCCLGCSADYAGTAKQDVLCPHRMAQQIFQEYQG